MVKVVVVPKKSAKAPAKAKLLASKRVATQGGYRVVTTVELDSPTLDQDLLSAFRKSVSKARKENKRVFGSTDAFRRKA